MATGDVDAKQGLGYDLIANGLSVQLDLGIRISDPAELGNETNFLDTTHSLTENNESEQPTELGSPLSRALETYYNAGNNNLLRYLRKAARLDQASLIDVHPIHPGQGDHNAFIRACGFINMGNIGQPLDGQQKSTLNIRYNDADDIVEQQDVVAPVAGDVILTEVETVSANISAGTVVATYAAPLYASGKAFFLLYLVAGTGDDDNASVEFVGVANGTIEVRATGAIGVGSLDFLTGIFDYPTRRALGIKVQPSLLAEANDTIAESIAIS